MLAYARAHPILGNLERHGQTVFPEFHRDQSHLVAVLRISGLQRNSAAIGTSITVFCDETSLLTVL